jgi:GT2 family glycosyltransferase
LARFKPERELPGTSGTDPADPAASPAQSPENEVPRKALPTLPRAGHLLTVHSSANPAHPAADAPHRTEAADEAARPLVTVIIPAYNAARFIRPTIDSVLDQTFQDFEFIVVDDGSTDDTADVVRSYEPRLRYLWKANGGQSSSRNVGIREARGEFIAFLDHDDLWYPEKLARQVALMQAAPRLGVVTTGSVLFDDHGDLQTEIPVLPATSGPALLARLLLGNVIGSCSKVLVRSACFRELGAFDEQLRMAEDWEMWYRIGLRYDIVVIPEPLIRYRIHQGNFSSHSARLNLANEMVFLQRAFAEPGFRPGPWLRGHALAERHLAAAIGHREAGEHGPMLASLARALLLHPPIAARKVCAGILLAPLRPRPLAAPPVAAR